jgi:serine/threonine-protein kinase
MNLADQQTPDETPTGAVEIPEAVDIDLTGKTLGDFRVERLIGRGGMGDVYLANQSGLNRPVALKVLRADFLSKPAYLSRFEIEATAIAKLNHPNIVHVYTLGCVDNVRFIAMEYVQGTNLKEYVIRKGALDLPLAFSIMRQAGQAIAAAAEVGLIHRDIKPENLLLTRKGRVKVADFGLCRDQEAEDVHLTQPGVTMGTPTYMSPEQAQGRKLDHRSDLYSLGVTFYYMLAGVPPFRGDTALALAIKHVKETPPNLRVHRPDTPVELDLLVMRLMAKDPNSRFQSASEMLLELSKLKDKMQLGTAQQPLYGENPTGPIPAVTAEQAGAPGDAAEQPGSSSLTLGIARIGQAVPGMISSLLGLKVMVPTVAVSILIGAGVGWSARAPDLIRTNAARSQRPPGLWLVDDLTKIPRMPTAEQQYRRAQLLTAPDQQVAAWLAVPARFPGERGWASQSYIQLGRHLFREKDRRGLAALADDLERWKDPRGKEPLTIDLQLARLLKIGAELLERDGKDQARVVDMEGVVEGLARMNLEEVYDTSLLELGYEVVAEASASADRAKSRAAGARLSTILDAITPRLMVIEALKTSNGLRTRRHG